MRILRTFGLALLVAIGCVTIGWIYGKRGASLRTGTEALLEPVRPVEAFAAQTSSPARSERQVALAVASAISTNVVEGAPVPSRSAQTTEPNEGEVNPADLRDLIHTTLQNQQVDPVWAREAKGRVREHLEKSTTDRSALRAIDCRMSICEATIEHDTPEDYAAFMEKAFKNLAFKWPGEVFVTSSGDASGRLAMLMYVSREGTRLPTF
jgi:hypothetical protein